MAVKQSEEELEDKWKAPHLNAVELFTMQRETVEDDHLQSRCFPKCDKSLYPFFSHAKAFLLKGST